MIRALYDYEARTSQELSFSRGDFFHVIGRENDSDWYEACNPALPDARGLVPVSYFKALGRTERDSANSDSSRPSPGATNNPDHDSGYAETSASSITPTPTTPGSNPQRMSKMGAKNGALVYGIVMYDFQAERADELEAKAGEAIIVIAQSNPEWFVAKPIGRLGGPGLIPVSFIEIRDMASNVPVQDPTGAIKRAKIPRVEEWKKMAADYKNSSITLGKFDVGGAPSQSGGGQSIEQGMERMSLQQPASARASQGNGQQDNVSCVPSIMCGPQYQDAKILLIGCIQLPTEHPTDPADTEPTIHRRSTDIATIRPTLSTDTPILLCRGQVLVCHRGRIGGWPTLGAVTILRRLLRFPDCTPHRIPRRSWKHGHSETHSSIHARTSKLRDRCNHRRKIAQPGRLRKEPAAATNVHF